MEFAALMFSALRNSLSGSCRKVMREEKAQKGIPIESTKVEGSMFLNLSIRKSIIEFSSFSRTGDSERDRWSIK